MLLIASIVCSYQTSVFTSRYLPPVLNQLGLCGLLPLVGLKMPTYPLVNYNLVLLIAMTSINLLFMVRKHTVLVPIFAIITLYMPMMRAFRRKRYTVTLFWTSLRLDGDSDIFDEATVSMGFDLHCQLTIITFFVLVALASKSLYNGKKLLNDFARLQIDRLNKYVFNEKKAYIVAELVTK